MDTTTDARLFRHVVATVLLAAAAVLVAWQVLFTGPGMGVTRYPLGGVFATGNGGSAMQTGLVTTARVVRIQQHRLPSGVPHAE
jgi:hypothetical protein